MKASLLALALCLGLGGFSFWKTARTQSSWTMTAFGISTGNRPDQDAYFSAAQTALDRWLLAQGYSPAVPISTPGSGMHAGVESSVAYPSGPSAQERVTVIVTMHQKTASGLNVSVHWAYEGFRWAVDRHDALARAACLPISQWWKEYQEKHPRP